MIDLLTKVSYSHGLADHGKSRRLLTQATPFVPRASERTQAYYYVWLATVPGASSNAYGDYSRAASILQRLRPRIQTAKDRVAAVTHYGYLARALKGMWGLTSGDDRAGRDRLAGAAVDAYSKALNLKPADKKTANAFRENRDVLLSYLGQRKKDEGTLKSGNGHLRAAEEAFRSRDYDTACNGFQSALDTFAKVSQISRDRELMQMSQQASQGWQNASREMAGTLLEQGQGADALRYVSKALELDPDDLEARELRARIHEAAGNWTEALADLQAVIAARPSATLHSRCAWCHFSTRNMAAALQAANRSIAADPQIGLPYYIRGECYLSQNDDQSAKVNLQRFLQQGEHGSRTDEARRLLTEIARREDDAQRRKVAALLAEAKKSYEGGEWATAVERFGVVLAMDKGNTEALRLRGMSRRQLREYSDALTDLNAALQQGPESAVVYCEIGLALFGLDRLAEAEEAFGKAIMLKDGHVYRYNRAFLLRRRQNYEQAKEDCDQAILMDNAYGPALWLRAALDLEGVRPARYETAAEVFRHACDLLERAAKSGDRDATKSASALLDKFLPHRRARSIPEQTSRALAPLAWWLGQSAAEVLTPNPEGANTLSDPRPGKPLPMIVIVLVDASGRLLPNASVTLQWGGTGIWPKFRSGADGCIQVTEFANYRRPITKENCARLRYNNQDAWCYYPKDGQVCWFPFRVKR